MNDYHTSVLLQEALAFLDIKPGKKYIDATLGGGGHTREILALGGEVLGIDQDPEALEYVLGNTKSPKLTLVQGSFEFLLEIAQRNKFLNCAGVLFDLGVSSHQLETASRGFSFRESGPLDMRMNPDLGVQAKDLVAALTEKELEELFTKYGEERWAKKIAQKIVNSRLSTPIQTTSELASLIEQTVGFPTSPPRLRSGLRGAGASSPRTSRVIHPATRVFQALRIAVNDEINSLKTALPQALAILGPKGRLVVISFHSLEDRIVKNFFREEESKGTLEILTVKPLEASGEETETNPRSRSAKLRAAAKL